MDLIYDGDRYDYDLCDKDSDAEYSDSEEVKEGGDMSDFVKKDSDVSGNTDHTHPYGTISGSSDSLSLKGKLPRSIKEALDGFSQKMSKTKSFH